MKNERWKRVLADGEKEALLNATNESVWAVFLLMDATDRSKISSDQKRLFLALRLNPLSFFANTPFKFIFLLELIFIV